MINKIIQSVKDTVRKIPGKRSSKWQTIRKHHLENNPTCASCGGKDKLEVHHIKEFHNFPDLELDPNNLITLCESGKHGIFCHLNVGHSGNFSRNNENVVEDANYMNKRLNKC